MERCDYIEPLLGAYQDGELSPTQAAAVQKHLDGCQVCSSLLLDFGLLGYQIREAFAAPRLEGFTDAVMSGLRNVAVATTPKTHARDLLRARWMPALTLASAVLAAGAWAVLLIGRLSIAPSHPAPVTPLVAAAATAARPSSKINQVANEQGDSPNSETFISSLETTDPSVAVWSEPDNKTTVIWLPDEEPGNN